MRVHSPFLQGLKNTAINLWISLMEGDTKNNLLVKIKEQVTLLELSGKHGEMVRGEPGRKNQLEEKFGECLESLSGNINVQKSSQATDLTLLSQPSPFAITSQKAKVCHQSTSKAAINNRRSLFTSLVKYRGKSLGEIWALS